TMGEIHNIVLHYAMEKNYSWLWMMDNDILNFYVRNKKRNIVSTPLLLRVLEPAIERSPVVLAGLDYFETPYHKSNDMIFDTYCYCCVALDVKTTGTLLYDPELTFHEDCDFLLNILTRGMHSMRFARYAFKVAPNGVAPGGIKKYYT